MIKTVFFSVKFEYKLKSKVGKYIEHNKEFRIKILLWLFKTGMFTLLQILVIRHLLPRQLLLRWLSLTTKESEERAIFRLTIGFLARGRVMIKIRVRVGVTFNVSVYHWSNCRRSHNSSNHSDSSIGMTKILNIFPPATCWVNCKVLTFLKIYTRYDYTAG